MLVLFEGLVRIGENAADAHDACPADEEEKDS